MVDAVAGTMGEAGARSEAVGRRDEHRAEEQGEAVGILVAVAHRVLDERPPAAG